MDVLGDILATLRLSSSLYFRADLSAPFSIAVPENRRVIRFHVASRGPCWIGLATGESVWGQDGDLILVPHGAAHVLADSPQTSTVPLSDVLTSASFDGAGPLVYGGGGTNSVIVCGYFSFQHEIVHPVIDSLPRLLHFSAGSSGRFRWIEQLLAYLEAEARDHVTGWQEVAQRLAEVLFICVLREYMGRSAHSTGGLMALADPRLGNALRAIHANPAADWSIAELASRAAMSKTVFAERFRAQLGVTPARYVVLWRMHKSRALLDRTDQPVGAIASSVGYESEAAFNRVFKAYFGSPPGRYRRTREDASDAR